MARRTFTRDEAESVLREIRPLAARMVGAWRSLETTREAQERLEVRIRGNGGGIPPQELAAAQDEVERAANAVAGYVEAIQERGVVVNDIESGLLDFPSIRDGREILLCWQLGEPAIAYWHDPEEGFAGRRPLQEG